MRVLPWLYYAGNAAVLLLLVLRVPQHLMPGRLSTEVGHNSEVFALALCLAAVVEGLRPRWTGRRWLPAVVGVIWVVLSALDFWLPLPPTVVTLNEPILATGLLTWYVVARRPLRAWVPTAVVVTLAGLLLLGWTTALVRQQAESVTAVAAVVIGLDLADRTLLAPAGEPDRPRWLLLASWYAVLLVLPAAMLATRQTHPVGARADLVDYLARGAEGFWGALLLVGYLRIRRSASDRG